MAISKTRKPPKPRAVAKARPVGDYCAGCGDPVDRKKVPYEMPSMFFPTEFACSKRCFDRWHEAHPAPKLWPV